MFGVWVSISVRCYSPIALYIYRAAADECDVAKLAL